MSDETSNFLRLLRVTSLGCPDLDDNEPLIFDVYVDHLGGLACKEITFGNHYMATGKLQKLEAIPLVFEAPTRLWWLSNDRSSSEGRPIWIDVKLSDEFAAREGVEFSFILDDDYRFVVSRVEAVREPISLLPEHEMLAKEIPSLAVERYFRSREPDTDT